MNSAFNRIDFENGSVFTAYSNLPNFFLVNNNNKLRLMSDYDKTYYAVVSEISKLGFTAGRKFFDKIVKTRINFSDCKLIKRIEPIPEASGMVGE